MNCHEPIEALYYSAKYVCIVLSHKDLQMKSYIHNAVIAKISLLFIKRSLTYNAHNLTVL